jgi:cell wall-associated NlpC family hydrolase
MRLEYEPGHIYHVNEDQKIDAELFYVPTENGLGFKVDALRLAFDVQGLGYERELLSSVMLFLKARMWPWLAQHADQNNATLANEFNMSGLLQEFYADIFGVPLPDSLEDQIDRMFAVDLSAVIPGDALFWRGANGFSKAGIYLGGGQMMSVSTSDGVVKRMPVGRFDLPDFARTLR